MTALSPQWPSASGASFGDSDRGHEYWASLHSDSYADVVERLLEDYHDRLSLHEITAVVAGCRRDLAGAPKGALAELIERLARQRISELL
ncbi:MAG: hypothetical protein QOK10_2194 [Pseudonocardiales bacterium]|jgi:hypothetical protein|nr:hypothetical protein [Actinomycetota bacterium]MDQ1732035.1 hypothetical protein [Pseudonocardiales bacterium]